MITGELIFQTQAYDNNRFRMILKISVKNNKLKSRNLSEEKTHPEHKYSVFSFRKSEESGELTDHNTLTKLSTYIGRTTFIVKQKQFETSSGQPEPS